MQLGDGGVGLGNKVPITAFCVPFWWFLHTLGGGQ